MEKKTPKVWENIVLNIYGSTIQVNITHLVKLKNWYKFEWTVRWKDFKQDKSPKDYTTKDSTLKYLHNEIKIKWFMDEYGNWWK